MKKKEKASTKDMVSVINIWNKCMTAYAAIACSYCVKTTSE